MALLFDQNISSRITKAFPGSIHVRNFGMERTNDSIIWEYAKRTGHTIVSKDGDFHQRSLLYGQPPKVIWIRRGNCPTQEIVSILQAFAADIEQFLSDPVGAFLVLS